MFNLHDIRCIYVFRADHVVLDNKMGCSFMGKTIWCALSAPELPMFLGQVFPLCTSTCLLLSEATPIKPQQHVLFLIMCLVCFYVWVCAHEYGFCAGHKSMVSFPEGGVTRGCELPYVVAEKWTRDLCKCRACPLSVSPISWPKQFWY